MKPIKKRQTQRDKDSFAYIRAAYGVPAHFGMRIWFQGREGIVTGGDGAHLIISWPGEGYGTGRYHPSSCMAYDRETPVDKRPTDTLGTIHRSDLYYQAQETARLRETIAA